MPSTGPLYLIAIQVFSRGLAFAGNQALLRYVSPAHLGLAVQLETLSTSVLYTARESLRVSLQRNPLAQQNDLSDETQKAVNAGWLVVLLGPMLGAIFGFSYLHYASEELSSSGDFELALWLYGGGTTFELLSEPGFIVVQQSRLFKDRARAETSAAIARCLTAYMTALYMQSQQMPMSVLPFAVGQLSYALCLLCVYSWTAGKEATTRNFSLLPIKLMPSSDVVFALFPKALLSMALAFYLQSIFKWLLTQGDVVVLSGFADLASQGIFALASNYAGLLSRLLFQPIEESSRNAFGQLLTASQQDGKGSSQSSERSPLPVQSRRQAMQYLATILRMYNLAITIPCVTLLPRLFPLLIQLLLGTRSRWNADETSKILSAYSYYLPCLALNGVLDAFVTSVATAPELRAQALMMVGVTMIYLSAAWYGITALGLGGVGLVYANILNMLLRILFSLWFIASWINDNLPAKHDGKQQSEFRRFWRSSMPSIWSTLTASIGICALTFQNRLGIYVPLTTTLSNTKLATRFAESGMDLSDLTYIVTVGVLLVSMILAAERQFLLEVLQTWLPTKIKTGSGLNDFRPSDEKKQ